MRARPLAATVAAALALTVAAGCGGDDEPTDSTTAPASTALSTSSSTRSATTQPTSTAVPTTATTSTTGTTPLTTVAPETTTTTTRDYDPEAPDSETNDKPPEPGSPQEAFEQACDANPDACG